MIESHYHFLGYESFQSASDSKRAMYTAIFQLLGEGIETKGGEEFAANYQADWLDRKIEFLATAFSGNGLDYKTGTFMKLPGKTGPAAISFEFSPHIAHEVYNTAIEIEEAASRSKAPFKSYKTATYVHYKDTTTIYSADFAKLDRHETENAVHILTTAFAAHEAFNPEIAIENGYRDTTHVQLTFPFFRPITTDIVTLEIANFAQSLSRIIHCRIFIG